MARTPVSVGDAVARGMHESPARQRRARPYGYVAGPQRLPGLAERLLPGIVQARPEPFGRHVRFRRTCISLKHGTRTYLPRPKSGQRAERTSAIIR